MKFRKRFLLLIPFTVLAVVGINYFRALRTPSYQSAAAVRATITQEALASGHVESPSNSDLHFKSSGKLISLLAHTGMKVTPGMVLAKEDSSILSAQLLAARESVSAAKSALAKLTSGATTQSIAVSSSGVDVAKQALLNRYSSAESTLLDAYAKGSDAVQNQLAPFFTNIQTRDPRLTFSLNNSQTETAIVADLAVANNELTIWQKENASVASSTDADALDKALVNADAHLAVLRHFLTEAIAAVNTNVGLSSSVAATYRANAAFGLTEINAASAEVIILQQSVSAAKASVAEANAGLDLTTHNTTDNDIGVAEANVRAVEANVANILAQMNDLTLVSPFAGTVTNTAGHVGEVVTPTTPLISLIPESALDIKVNVAEGNIVGIKPGQPVIISLDAFPIGAQFYGTVSAIDPAETIIGGAIYYQTTVLFNQNYPDLKPGMTANVRIETGSSSDALLIPASALIISSTSTLVNFLNGTSISLKPVTTGLTSQDGMVEIVSGLSEGDRVVIGSN